MKAITLWQPWATLIALGVKRIETRSWQTSYRGPLAIHAARRPPPLGLTLGPWTVVGEGPHSGGWRLLDNLAHDAFVRAEMPLGAVVATCTLADCAPIGGPYDFRTGVLEGDEGDYPDRHVLVVNDHQHPASAGHPRLTLDPPRDAPKPGGPRDVTDQWPYGDYTPGRYAWLLEDICRLDPIEGPPPARGRQGLWEWEPPCPHCRAADMDRGATGLDLCNTCGGLSRGGRTLTEASRLAGEHDRQAEPAT